MVAPLKTSDVFRDLPDIETERLLLRKVGLDDAEDVFRYASDPEVTRYLHSQPLRSIEDSRKVVRAATDDYAAGRVRSWGVVHKGDKRLIGTAGFQWWRPESFSANIGYLMAREYWGQGLMPEAVRAVLRFGFERMQLNRIEARLDPENAASARLLEKVGMTREGTLRDDYYIDGAFYDGMVYSILRREWSAEGVGS